MRSSRITSRLRGGVALGGLTLLASLVGACKTSDLTAAGAEVSASRNAPPPGCESMGYLTGKGGGSFGGGMVSNEDLIEYALNDLRNQAAEKNANFIQHDPPGLGSGDGTTTSVTITGTAYKCPEGPPAAGAAPPPATQPAPEAQPAPAPAAPAAAEPAAPAAQPAPTPTPAGAAPPAPTAAPAPAPAQ